MFGFRVRSGAWFSVVRVNFLWRRFPFSILPCHSKIEPMWLLWLFLPEEGDRSSTVQPACLFHSSLTWCVLARCQEALSFSSLSWNSRVIHLTIPAADAELKQEKYRYYNKNGGSSHKCREREKTNPHHNYRPGIDCPDKDLEILQAQTPENFAINVTNIQCGKIREPRLHHWAESLESLGHFYIIIASYFSLQNLLRNLNIAAYDCLKC